MKWYPLPFVVIALLSTVACSRQRSPEVAPSAPLRPATATPASPRDLAQEDLHKLQGTWRIESSLWNGVLQPDIAKGVTILFRGDKFIVVDIDGKRVEETIKMIPDQNPKAIDCWSKPGGQAAPGIYSLEEDRFTWCSAGASNKVRPSSFVSKPGSKQSLMVLRREKS